jgi:rare lipoprotein A
VTRWLVLLLVGFTLACGGPQPGTTKGGGGGRSRAPGVQSGKASWYGGKHHGGPTASGERFDKHAMTAAHRRHRFGTRVRVTNKRNGRSVVVRINDRGPYTKGRIIDLSEAAAKKLDMIDAGVVPVTVEVVRD